MSNNNAQSTPGFRLNPNVVSQQVEDGAVLVHGETSRIYELNDTGSRFWQLLKEGLRLDDIKAKLLMEYAVEPSELERELTQMLEQFKREKLVTI